MAKRAQRFRSDRRQLTRIVRSLQALLAWAVRTPELRKPRNAEILVFDAELSELLVRYFGNRSYRILHQRARNLNFPILLRAIRRGFSLESYLIEYALAVNPHTVVSMLDNEASLYRLKSALPHARIVAIQNGWRGITYDIFGLDGSPEGKGLQADDILVFGPAVGRKFESLVQTRTIPIGSFKSNLVPVHRAPDSRVIALVSTVRQKVDLNEFVPVGTGLSTVKYEQIFERRLELARLVYQFARQEGFHLRVLGKDAELGREYEMYQHHLGSRGDSWSFTPRTTLLANYGEIDQAHAVVSSSSTLGYEALGRGARSAFFMIDYEVLQDEGTRFGWPLSLPVDGPFWTHTLSADRVAEVLHNVVLSPNHEWQTMSQDVANELIAFDPDNSIFARLMEQP